MTQPVKSSLLCTVIGSSVREAIISASAWSPKPEKFISDTKKNLQKSFLKDYPFSMTKKNEKLEEFLRFPCLPSHCIQQVRGYIVRTLQFEVRNHTRLPVIPFAAHVNGGEIELQYLRDQ